MTDREMLEFAAKAAGYTLTWGEKYLLGDDEVDCSDIPYIKSTAPDVSDGYWNPLIDDGDALRLAVDLHFTVRAYMGSTTVQSTVPGGPSVYVTEINEADPCAATRLAITRAAAEIGRTMP